MHSAERKIRVNVVDPVRAVDAWVPLYLYAAHQVYPLYLLDWYRSTVLGGVQRLTTHGSASVCLSSTLRISAGVARELLQGTQFACFYWYKSANTDAGGVGRAQAS